MTGRRLSKDGERAVTRVYPSPSTKESWKTEANNEQLSLSRYLHNQIQEARVLRDEGRLKLGDRHHVEELLQHIEELETQMDDPRNFTVAAIMAKTSCRITEACRIKEDDLRLDDEFIRLSDRKGGRETVVPIDDELGCVLISPFRDLPQ